MAEVIFYGMAGCPANARQKQQLTAAGHTLDLKLAGDYTHARNADTGEPLPRIAPLRLSAGLDWGQGPWSAGVSVTRAFAQHRLGSPALGRTRRREQPRIDVEEADHRCDRQQCPPAYRVITPRCDNQQRKRRITCPHAPRIRVARPALLAQDHDSTCQPNAFNSSGSA